jgi:hypothetical protein
MKDLYRQSAIRSSAKKRNESIQNTMIKAEFEGRFKNYNKGTWIPMQVAPGNVMPVHEKNIEGMVRRANKK